MTTITCFPTQPSDVTGGNVIPGLDPGISPASE